MIRDIIKEYEKVRQKESELSLQLSEYYQPIIDELSKKKDKKRLEKLLDELPDSLVKMDVYRALRELKK